LNYQLITTDSQLQQVCTQACYHRQVALDTEFVRINTYYPQLGLIQLYDGEQLSLIDPQGISEWQPFLLLLQNKNVVKFLHAGSEDLEIFLNKFNQLPDPVLDTQVLAAFSGKTLSCGFSALVAQYLNVVLDKSESRTDWTARPLNEKQCLYAAADVFYLLPLANQLIAQTTVSGYMDAALDECLLLCRRRSEILDPELAYLEITNLGQLPPRQLACLQKLASWRLRQAREHDTAINFIVREAHLWQVARWLPTSLSELSQLGLSGQEIRHHGRTLLALVHGSRLLAEVDLPASITCLVACPGYKKIVQDIKALIQSVSNETHLSSGLLASRRQINQLLNWHWQLTQHQTPPELLTGWRGDLLAQPLQTILAQH
jgi:ribonuclease D